MPRPASQRAAVRTRPAKPSITTVSDNVAAMVGVVPNRGLSNDRSPAISGRLSAPLARGERLQIFDGNRLLGTARVNARAGTWSFAPSFTAATPTTVSLRARVRDAAGTLGPPSPARSFRLDPQAPSLSFSDNIPGIAAGPVTVFLTFSETISGFSADDIVVTGGSKGSFTGAGKTFTLIVNPTPNSSGTLTVAVPGGAALDGAGNPSTAAQTSQVFDIQAPTLAISDNAPGVATGPVTFSFVFSEPVTGFTAADILVTGGIKGSFAGAGTTYTLVVTPNSNATGTITVQVGAGAGADANGNPSLAPTQTAQGFDTRTAINLLQISGGDGGFVINGQAAYDNSGISVASAGDVNGDGLDDLLVGAFNSDPAAGASAGRSYVVFGKATTSAIHLSAIANGSGGFVINGQATNDRSGRSVAGAGDINGDGFADLLIGAYNSDPAAGANAGRSSVIFGKASTTAVDLSAIAAGSGGFVINGQGASDRSGFRVASAGDVNGDGLADLLIGAYRSDPEPGSDAGRTYVVFGQTSATAVDLSAIAGGSGGFVINGQCTTDQSGFSVASAGDVNGDGLADLLVGAFRGDPAAGGDAGRSYVVFGKARSRVHLSDATGESVI
ncbi:MAG: Ig-like domain-containing protein, partial [Synechococcaceae cyanobacterium]